mmetsp:Transcript_35791/g.46333  ORF Transcript_35791/g.46333 Transcript_35791/m.46333 type:complete len:248 (-) Transcript_35791:147-890(-)|eukprot:CAMPEP_0183720028 /NCGR_PEP_ID=MMETSP0737-20130205/12764_1 /TAXON_ID=385413 /ORGANISM="Thalassiosira miniscula, Strain CCMP1093" /LENGTH=247 /DNA_ID=CAMNT_0025949835 /DNA_START=81 /DNA_END=824 /DNA_ORIENTATION=-
MNPTAVRPRKFLVATAALAAVPAASALLASNQAHSSHIQQLFGRPSFFQLEARQQSFSELDKLRAKRLSIRRRRPAPEVEVAPKANVAEVTVTEGSFNGLEYLYEAGEERYADDLFHIILMPSTFKKHHMSIENTAESCTEVLGIPSTKAHELSLFAKYQGFSCLGTWTREECLDIGKQLVLHDLDCRVIPFTGAGALPETLAKDVLNADVPSAGGNRVLSVDPPAEIGESVRKAFVEDTYLLSFTS